MTLLEAKTRLGELRTVLKNVIDNGKSFSTAGGISYVQQDVVTIKAEIKELETFIFNCYTSNSYSPFIKISNIYCRDNF